MTVLTTTTSCSYTSAMMKNVIFHKFLNKNSPLPCQKMASCMLW